jgi:hypothetical protein
MDETESDVLADMTCPKEHRSKARPDHDGVSFHQCQKGDEIGT